MNCIRICQGCKKSINIKKDQYYTEKSFGIKGILLYHCNRCGKILFETVDAAEILKSYEITLHIHAGKDYSVIHYSPFNGIHTVNDDAPYMKMFKELGAAGILKSKSREELPWAN